MPTGAATGPEAHVKKASGPLGILAVSVALGGRGPRPVTEFRDRLLALCAEREFRVAEVRYKGGDDWMIAFLGTVPEAGLDEALVEVADELGVVIYLDPAVPVEVARVQAVATPWAFGANRAGRTPANKRRPR